MIEEDLFDPELDGGLTEDAVDDHCGPPVNRDCVDDALESLIDTLVKSGYDEEVANEAVYQCMATLIESNAIRDTPDLDQPETAKHAWIANASTLMRQKLVDMGLDFENG